MLRSMRMRLFCVLALAALGCGDDDAAEVDASMMDSGLADASSDAEPVDSDADSDSGPDASPGPDDAGSDDAGSDDAGSDDAGSDDAGSNDAGSDDASSDGSVCTPTGAELCDGIDNDCAGGIDDGIECALWEGTGVDGDLTVSTGLDLDIESRPGLDTPYAATGALIGIGGSELTLDADAAGLSPGDEVLIINLRGDEADSGSVGHYETRFVHDVTASVVTLRNALTNTYGVNGANDDFTGQTVVVMRVPHFETLTIEASGTVTSAAFDGMGGGVIFFRARTLNISTGAQLGLSGGGYRGSRWAANGRMGRTGESLGGWPETPQDGPVPSNVGGGVGGTSDCDVYTCTTQQIGAAGGGASYATLGTSGEDNGALHVGGAAGATYGDESLSSLYLGSGGGGGAGGFSGPGSGTVGGSGGGLVVVHAGVIDVSGVVTSDGQIGSVNNNCGSRGAGGGGAGSGGTIWLTAMTMTLGADTISALGGSAQCNGGGVGGDGRVRLDFGTLNGSTGSDAMIAAASACTPDPGVLGSL